MKTAIFKKMLMREWVNWSADSSIHVYLKHRMLSLLAI
jgi:hypothetical protein